MSETFFDRPELYRSLLESLPIGIYILDREHRVRFWNRRAEQLTGHLAHEAMGQDGIGHLLEPCDRDGRAVKGGNCSVTAALTRGHEQQFTAFYLHKDGHRVAVRGRARAIFEANDAIAGAVVLFKEAFASGEESSGTAMYGCMDPSTGIPDLSSYPRSAGGMPGRVGTVAAGLRRAADPGAGSRRVSFQTRHPVGGSLSADHGAHPAAQPRSGEFSRPLGGGRFLAVLSSASPVAAACTAETVWSLVTHSKISWWGDRFPVEAVVSYIVARPGDKLEQLLNRLEPAHAAGQGRAVGTASGGAKPELTRG